MNKPVVSYQLQNQLGIIHIDNPPVNALSHPVRAGIMSALALAAKDTSLALLILCRGRTFIAGADITEFGKPPLEPHLPDVITAIESSPKPVVAALHGNALGGGLEVALAAHYRCSVATTKLGLPEVKLGLLPGAGGTQRLPRVVGVEAALDMMTSGTPISAHKARELGLVDEVLEGELESTATDYANRLIAEGAPVRATGAQRADAPDSADFYDQYRSKISRKSRGQIAPGFIIELAELATHTDIDEGQAVERERFIECRNSPQASAMQYVFFAERATGKLGDIPKDTPVLPVQSVAVIGAGTMGGGIAMCLANAGIPVTLVETQQEFLDRGMATIKKNYATSVKRGRFSQEQADAFLANFSGTTNYADIGDVDIVIEAVFENMDIKKEVFAKLDASCKPGCILATNTSYLNVDEIAATTNRPQQVIGAHFFSPANVMKLLEVVRTEKTSPEVVQTFMKLAKKIGKIPVAVGVCNGFVGNRMLKGYARQAQLLLLEGASPEQIDQAMQTWGMAMGPIAVGDLAGLDIGYRSRRDQGIESRSVKESALADTLVEMERLGQKSGAGYYRYDAQTRERQSDPEVASLIENIAAQLNVKRREINDSEIVERLVLALVNEGAAILKEGIAARPSDIDIVYLNGYGFPAWRGGPMYYADTLGLDIVIDKLNALKALTGDPCWEPSALILEISEASMTLGSLN
ncbi:MAG: enoyl-CoA hydratase/isomerase family protein [Proteobacteria bacterium]|nr:enoyl-CoA hydratase/isomerase family protein [Pseudomonadota bacterium]